MNLLSLILGTAVNLIYSPFSENQNIESVVTNKREINDLSSFPFSLLRRTAACSTTTVQFGEAQLIVSAVPKGYCTNCCPINLEKDVTFKLYNNYAKGVKIMPYNEIGAAATAGINPKWKTIIFIHGFTEPSPGDSGKAIVEAYLSRPENYNIILLQWGELAAFPWYPTAVQNVKLVGKMLQNFIEIFNDSGEMPIENLHVIGFSLGCHVASTAGKQLKNGIRIPRITALDPAFPEYSLKDRSKRLANTDADYIDVIHTDSGIFGWPDPIGHADFYPNDGKALQPGCQPSYLAQERIAELALACSHIRAWQLYVESVKNPKAFPSTGCPKWRGVDKECNFTMDAYMGFGIDQQVNGQFYLRTRFKSPYGLSIERQL